MNRLVTHPKDVEYFNDYPAPLMELLHSAHKTYINSTITFFGPMLYFLARALCWQHVAELGHAEGYTAWYLANAVKDNGIRFGTTNVSYTGIDIIQTESTQKLLEGLPAQCLKIDSMTLTQDTFNDKTFDMIFQDGCHDTQHILHEMHALYPRLRKDGKGYWIMHDTVDPGQEGWEVVKKLIETGVYKFEYVNLPEIHGMAILRRLPE